MNQLYEKMLSAYDQSTDTARRNAVYEVSQQIVLAGLADGGFFDKAAFYGGTCLRIFHGLNRFSEDMDFTLLKEDPSFNFEQYFQPIIDQFSLVGRKVEIKKKDKRSFGKVESAFLKDTTDVYDISFQTEKSIKVKIEVDTVPPLKFSTEQKYLLQPKSFLTAALRSLTFLPGKCTRWFSGRGREGSRGATGMILNGMYGTASLLTGGTCKRGSSSSTVRR